MLDEMTPEQFIEWAAYEMIESGQARPAESDLPAMAQQHLQRVMRGGR